MNYQITKRRKKLESFSGGTASIWVTMEVIMKNVTKIAEPKQATAKVYCPMCTHTVDANVEPQGRHMRVSHGQKCPRCSGALDAGYIMYLERAA